jgi:outer membrane immunogenic protein
MVIRSLAVAAVALLSTTAATYAADLIIPTTPQPIMESSGFSWDGLYLGVHGGGEFFNANTYGVIGAHAGANFIVADPLLLGVEITADYAWSSTVSYVELFANGRIGVVADQVLIYALAGTGIESSNNASNGVYQLGGGVEFAVTDSISVRGQLVGYGYYNNNDLFSGAKATVGISFHF